MVIARSEMKRDDYQNMSPEEIASEFLIICDNDVTGRIIVGDEEMHVYQSPGLTDMLPAFRRELAMLVKTLRAEQTTNDKEYVRVVEEYRNEVRSLTADLAVARDVHRGNLWYWGDDDEDHPESLVCPIVIRPESMRKLLGECARLKQENEELNRKLG